MVYWWNYWCISSLRYTRTESRNFWDLYGCLFEKPLNCKTSHSSLLREDHYWNSDPFTCGAWQNLRLQTTENSLLAIYGFIMPKTTVSPICIEKLSYACCINSTDCKQGSYNTILMDWLWVVCPLSLLRDRHWAMLIAKTGNRNHLLRTSDNATRTRTILSCFIWYHCYFADWARNESINPT